MSSWGAAPNQPISSGVQAGEVLCAARTHLNDDEGIIWPDQKLFPKLREAHRAMQLALVQNGVPVIQELSVAFSVTKGVKDLTTIAQYPQNILMPIWMKERNPGQRDQDYANMREVEVLPTEQPTTSLSYWCWNKQRLLTLGCTQNREILLRYRGGIKIPQESTDPIGPYFGELYLSYKTAALAIGSISPGNTDRVAFLENQANSNLEDLLSNAAIQAQNLPAKRRPYHR